MSDILTSSDLFGEFALWDIIQKKSAGKTRLYHVFAGLPYKRIRINEQPVIIQLRLQDHVENIGKDLNWIQAISNLMHEKSFTKFVIQHGRAKQQVHGLVLAALWLGFRGYFPITSCKFLDEKSSTAQEVFRPKKPLKEFTTDTRFIWGLAQKTKPPLERWKYPMLDWLTVIIGRKYQFEGVADFKDNDDFTKKLNAMLQLLLAYDLREMKIEKTPIKIKK